MLVLDAWCCLLVATVQGAATQVYLATSPDIQSGEYYADCTISPSTAESRDATLGRALWQLSEKMVASI